MKNSTEKNRIKTYQDKTPAGSFADNRFASGYKKYQKNYKEYQYNNRGCVYVIKSRIKHIHDSLNLLGLIRAEQYPLKH